MSIIALYNLGSAAFPRVAPWRRVRAEKDGILLSIEGRESESMHIFVFFYNDSLHRFTITTTCYVSCVTALLPTLITSKFVHLNFQQKYEHANIYYHTNFEIQLEFVQWDLLLYWKIYVYVCQSLSFVCVQAQNMCILLLRAKLYA